MKQEAPSAAFSYDTGANPAAAAAAAAKADVAIVFADQYMSEGGDALTLDLPHKQSDLIHAVAAANPDQHG